MQIWKNLPTFTIQMNNLFKILTVIFAALFIFSLLFNREQNIEAEILKRDNEGLKVEKFKLRQQYEEIISTKDKEYYNAFKSAQEKANRFEALAIESQRQLKHEKALNRRFTDSQTDSLLFTVGQ